MSFQAADLNKPIDKRTYKGTCPTCHDFGALSSSSSSAGADPNNDSKSNNSTSDNGIGSNSDVIPLLIGFSQGQIQLVDSLRKELSKLFNEDVRVAEKSAFTLTQNLNRKLVVADIHTLKSCFDKCQQS